MTAVLSLSLKEAREGQNGGKDGPNRPCSRISLQLVKFVSAGFLGNLTTDASGLNSSKSTMDGRLQETVEEHGAPPAAAHVPDGIHFVHELDEDEGNPLIEEDDFIQEFLSISHKL